MTWYRQFKRNGGLNRILPRDKLPLPLWFSVPRGRYTGFRVIMGVYLKNFAERSEARKCLGYFVGKIKILCKKIIFFPFLGEVAGCAPPLESATGSGSDSNST